MYKYQEIFIHIYIYIYLFNFRHHLLLTLEFTEYATPEKKAKLNKRLSKNNEVPWNRNIEEQRTDGAEKYEFVINLWNYYY